ncbi:MAG TPA: DUF2169 domain-containing protein [Pseudoduganella sp.]
MWMINNKTPYEAERTWVQDKDANKIWLVVMKATFDILPDGSTRLAEQQVPVWRMGLPTGELGKSSLIYEADLMGVKPGTDILVNGMAWTPGGRPARSVDVELSVASIHKRLRVFGDRVWQRSLVGGATMSSPEPFESMPIQYERSYGGWDRSAADRAEHRLESRNPVGTGFAVLAEGCVDMQLPNIEYPDQLISSWKDRPAPAGLNAIECQWTPRRELAGTYDENWRAHRVPLWAEDFDQRYHQCAPADQQVPGFLLGGEAIQLINLSRDGQLSFHLPRIYPFFETYFGAERIVHRGQLCTVIVEPEIPRVVMAWQTSLMCNHRVDQLDATVVSEKRMI